MKRTTLAFALAVSLAGATTAALLPGCTASVDSGCLGGPCGDDAGVKQPAPDDAGDGGCSSACYADYHLVEKCDVANLPTEGDIPCDVWAVMHKQPLDSGGCHKCHQNPPKMARRSRSSATRT